MFVVVVDIDRTSVSFLLRHTINIKYIAFLLIVIFQNYMEGGRERVWEHDDDPR